MTRLTSPLEEYLAAHWDQDPERLRLLVERRFGVRVEPGQIDASDASALASALKGHVDHPGRLERLAERLLRV